MKQLIILLLLFFIPSLSYAAISNAVAYDVRTTGNDTNGGGFVTTASGTDWSQQNSPQYSVTDGVTNGTTTITSATASFGTDVVGNIMYVSGGTGSVTASWYQIVSRTNSTTVVVDRSTGLTAGTGVTLHIGGSFATIQNAMNVAWITAATAITDSRVYVKKGTYTATVALTDSGAVSPSNYLDRLIGYNLVHDDNPTPESGNQPIYAVGSGAGVDGYDHASGVGVTISNMTFDGTATSGTQGVKGINTTTTFLTVLNCKIMNFSAEGFKSTQTTSISFSEITGCTGTNAAVDIAGGVAFCWIHKNSNSGINTNVGAWIIGNLITNNTNDGIDSSYQSIISENTIYGNGRDGIRSTSALSLDISSLWVNNIFAKNGGYGINFTVGLPIPSTNARENHNAFYGNIILPSHNITLNSSDVTISSNPFVSSDANLASETSPNWGLNNTASAGASLRAVGFPGTMPGLSTTTGYRDIGAVQHQDSGGSSYTGFFIQ